MSAPSGEGGLVVDLRRAVQAGEGELVGDDGRLPPERALMTLFGVGRRSIRNALEALEAEGLVFRRQGQGTFVRPTNPTTPRIASLANNTSPVEIMEVRREIEPALAKLAALRATPSDIEQMLRLAERGGGAETAAQYEKWDSAFHAKIAESVRNSLFQGLFEVIRAVRVEQKWTALRAQIFSQRLRDDLVAQHLTIARAIADRDPDGAEAAMRAHLAAVSLIMRP